MASEGHWIEDLQCAVLEPGEWWVFKGQAHMAPSLRSGRIKRPDVELAGTDKDPWEFTTRQRDLWVRYDPA